MAYAHTNALIHEKSPYLLQHAHNPVDWLPWGKPALDRAREQNKPIFLSIGYSTCHWCHVMEHESFEDETMAVLLNQHFVCIKVDREERPDIDATYMTVCQMVTGHGGWPLSVFLTPDKEPFYVGTYFPPQDRHGRPGFATVLRSIAASWQNEREKIVKSGGALLAQIREHIEAAKKRDSIDIGIFDAALESFSRQFDADHGGFGARPKFPTPHKITFLLGLYRRSAEPEALEMAEATLEAMRHGGIYDHIGFGFHRYSTDAQWLLPHFEKMLYDQAGLMLAYTEAFQATQKPHYRKTAMEIAEYVLRDMTSPEGGFYSAEDADSEGREGQFYVWTAAELQEVLSADDYTLFKHAYAITDEGNFIEEVGTHTTGENIPHMTRSVEELAAELGRDSADLDRQLENIRHDLFKLRERRIHPHKDDKVLADWNAFMIVAFARAARAFSEPQLLQAAQHSWNFLEQKMLTDDGRRLHRFRDGEAAIDGFLDDYALGAWAALELYQADGSIKYLHAGIRDCERLMADFADKGNGGFVFSSARNETMPLESKEAYDGAMPSGNSIAAHVLGRFGKLLGRQDFVDAAIGTVEAFAAAIERQPIGFAFMLQAYDFLMRGSREIVVAYGAQQSTVREHLSVIDSAWLPFSVVVHNDGSDELKQLIEHTSYRVPKAASTASYVCVNYACQAPVTEPQDLKEALLR